jgi:DNA-binding response OmpR family regulator
VGESATAVEEIRHLIHSDGLRVLMPSSARGRRDAQGSAGENAVPDLVVLDIAEHETISHIEERLSDCRAQWQRPVLCLVPIGKGIDTEAVAKLSADDYLFKPARIVELGSRIRTLWERHKPSHRSPLVDRRRGSRRREDRPTVPDPQVVDNRCAVNDFLKRVVIDGKVINLSPKEY